MWVVVEERNLTEGFVEMVAEKRNLTEGFVGTVAAVQKEQKHLKKAYKGQPEELDSKGKEKDYFRIQ